MRHRIGLLGLAAVAACVLVAACAREPAHVKDLQLLSRALTNAKDYFPAVAQLEKDPKGARRALGEQSAPHRTRREFLLRLIGERVSNPGRYAAWDATVKQQSDRPLTNLTDDRYWGFWSEKLLFGDAASAASAAKHLVVIDSEEGWEALTWRLCDTTRDPDDSWRTAAQGLAETGDYRSLADALTAWYSAEGVHAATVERAVEEFRQAGRTLPANVHRAAEQEFLKQLGESKVFAERKARLVLLESVVSPSSLTRLATLRRSLPAALRADMDAVMIAAMSRDPKLASLGEASEGRR